MCGIIGCFHTGQNANPVNEAVLNQFEDQKERGLNGFGIIKINDKMEYKVERATEGYKFMWDIHSEKVRAMIVHHRTPTSSDNLLAQTHPILVDNGSLKYKYLVVHNGIIQNDNKLKEAHEKLGFAYATEYTDKSKYNDSECFTIELARFIEKQSDKVNIEGSAAFICVQINRETEKISKLFFGRNTNPLNMAKTRGKLFLSSTGQGSEIEANTLYSCKLDEEMKLKKEKMPFAEVEKKEVKATCFPAWDYDYKEDKYGEYIHYKWKPANQHGKRYEKNVINEGPEDEPTELEMALEDKNEEVFGTLDSFFDMLYNEYQIETISEKDIDLTLESIRISLLDALKEAKTIHANDIIDKDYQPTIV